MALSTQPYKGARDFYPEDKRIQKYMFNKMRSICERFGYQEYDAPVLEPVEMYLAKTSEEIVNEQTYTLEDRGGRKVALRPEMTPTVSRLIAARRQELAYPVRLFNIGTRYRYERPQRGRYREFFQLDVDIFGIDGVTADHEIILVADRILRNFGASTEMYQILLNSRKLTDYLFGTYLGLSETQAQLLVRLIDRMKKMEYESFIAQADAVLTPEQRDKGVLDSLFELLKARKLSDLPSGADMHESVSELQALLGLLESSGVINATFDITLMRGFDYYTDIVFEVVDTDPENNRSMFGGGRYDGLVGLFGVEPVPTVGFAMGDVTLQNFLESHGLLPELKPETEVYVVLIGDDTYAKAQHVFSEFREMGLNIAIDSTGRKMDKQIKTAVKQGVPYVLFIGEEELASGQFKIRNLANGEEQTHSAQRIVSLIKDHRNHDEE